MFICVTVYVYFLFFYIFLSKCLFIILDNISIIYHSNLFKIAHLFLLKTN